MAAACVAGASGTEAEVEAPVPVKNTFIHFGAGRARSLRVCVTDPEDPKLWQPRAQPKEPTVPEESLCGQGAITEESAADPEEQKGSSPASPNEILHIQTPEASPRNGHASPWSSLFGSPPSANGPNRATPTSTPQAAAVVAAATAAGLSRWTPVSTPQAAASAGASCSSALQTPIKATPPPPTQVLATDGGQSYKFTLRLADDVGLGVDLATDAMGGLFVQGVLPNGAIDSWNRRCIDSRMEGKVVNTGDAVVCVNGKTDSQSILGECRSKLLLSMTFVRKGGAVAEDASRSIVSAAPSAVHSAVHSAAHSVTQSPGSDRGGGRTPGKENKVFLQIHAALEGERLHASKSLLLRGGGH